MKRAPTYVQVRLKEGARDVRGERVAKAAQGLGIDTGAVSVSRIYVVDVPLAEAALAQLPEVAQATLADDVLEETRVDAVAGMRTAYALVSRLPGVTDDEGMTAHRVLAAALSARGLDAGFGKEQRVFAQWLYAFEREVCAEDLSRLGREVLGNPVVDHIVIGLGAPKAFEVPSVTLPGHPELRTVSLRGTDAELETLSRERGLHLSLPELHAIRRHFAEEVKREPTECELEVFAQTWSEHCKHKEFNAKISMSLGDRSYEVDSLFKSFIRKATEDIRGRWAARGEDWMLTVFSDNAGVVALDDDKLFVLKVETHNSPSALDPVGGAMTGVLGTNRDAFGTGKGGGRLFFNTNVLCFGPKDYKKPLLPGQMHPARIAEGVVEGIEHAGNKCGVPTVNGAIVFDDRFAGKPLVYCGTGSIMPRHYPNGPSWEKDIRPGYRIVTVGGRVGQDGIHGATFSSTELDEKVTRGVVQIGSPITQKFVADFMEEACALGLVAGSTDNGAGGLSSSIGELATFSNGAQVELSHVPLKYGGLEPWEIFLSESQERMTLAVLPEKLPELLALATLREVEATDIGAVTGDGVLDVRFKGAQVARLDLAFLHDGVPRKHLVAEWSPPVVTEPDVVLGDLGEELLGLLGSSNIASRERVIRRFDHEVKGKSIVKSLMGERGIGPQGAAVLRASFDGFLGVGVASGICPKFGDLDPYEMAAGAFDEAVRSLISVGARLPLPGEAPSWSACDNFCVPDSVYHPETNPDGKTKLGQLVRMCEALYDMSTFFDVPMTSGKDSMKNDLRSGGVKISVPPTVLFTMVAKMPDVRVAVTSELKAAGDVVYLVGRTYDELGGSELLRLHGALGTQVPRVRKEDAKRVYHAMMAAHAEGLLASSHDCSDGGLGVALAECAIGSGLGATVALPAGLPPASALFSESHSRFVVTVRPEHAAAFEEILRDDATRLGLVTSDGRVTVRQGEARASEATAVLLFDVGVDALTAAFTEGGV